jgi:hypothetical protein
MKPSTAFQKPMTDHGRGYREGEEHQEIEPVECVGGQRGRHQRHEERGGRDDENRKDPPPPIGRRRLVIVDGGTRCRRCRAIHGLDHFRQKKFGAALLDDARQKKTRGDSSSARASARIRRRIDVKDGALLYCTIETQVSVETRISGMPTLTLVADRDTD